MLRIWLIYNLILTTAIFGFSIKSTHTLSNLFLPLLLLPVLYYLGNEFSRKMKLRQIKNSINSLVKTPIIDPQGISSHSVEEGVPVKGVSDQDRRLFLRLIGTSSLSVLFMVLLGKREAHAAFFGSVPGPGTVSVKNIAGEAIDPAELQPTDGYTITEVDDSATPSYYGFVHKTGAWYITKEDATGGYRYTKGATAFSTGWTGRVALTYDYFDNVF